MKHLFLILAFFIIYVSSSAQITDSLKAAYYFNANVTDSVGNLDLVNNGATFTSNRFGVPNSAVNLNGSSYLELSNANSFKSNAYTLSGWVKINQLPNQGSQGAIINLGNTSMDHGLNLANDYLNTYDGFTAYSYSTSSTVATAYNNVTPSTGVWYHLVMTRDNQKIAYYVNGILADDSPLSVGPGWETNIKLWLGARYGNQMFFKGVIDDVLIFSKALTSSEVTALYSFMNEKSENLMSNNFKIYPNLSSDKVTIQSDDNTFNRLMIYNSSGSLIMNIETSETNNFEISIREQGVYFVQCFGDNYVKQLRFIIQ